jgi:hypothetical protein
MLVGWVSNLRLIDSGAGAVWQLTFLLFDSLCRGTALELKEARRRKVLNLERAGHSSGFALRTQLGVIRLF